MVVCHWCIFGKYVPWSLKTRHERWLLGSHWSTSRLSCSTQSDFSVHQKRAWTSQELALTSVLSRCWALDYSQQPLLIFLYFASSESVAEAFGDVSFSVLRQFRCGLSSKISTSLFYFSRAGGLAFYLPSSFAILWRTPCNDDVHRA